MTASARPDIKDPTWLGQVDVQAMRQLYELVSGHVTTLQARGMPMVAAAGDPDEYIPEGFLADFELLADRLWLEFAAVSPVILKPSLYDEAVLTAKLMYQDFLRLVVGEQIFKAPVLGEFISGALVQYGDVRPLLVALGGGSTEPTVQLQGGLGSGKIFADAARDQGIDLGNERIWLYGALEQPRRNFNGHMQMDGLVFTDWADDALRISPQDRWIRTTHYYPGDHYGCSCVVAPYVPNFGDPFTLNLSQ